jgi:hypothetical protein
MQPNDSSYSSSTNKITADNYPLAIKQMKNSMSCINRESFFFHKLLNLTEQANSQSNYSKKNKAAALSPQSDIKTAQNTSTNGLNTNSCEYQFLPTLSALHDTTDELAAAKTEHILLRQKVKDLGLWPRHHESSSSTTDRPMQQPLANNPNILLSTHTPPNTAPNMNELNQSTSSSSCTPLDQAMQL